MPPSSFRNIDEESSIWYDSIINDRNFWKIGFSVEVYSTSDNFWYPGQIIKVSGKETKRRVEVMYNGRIKSLRATSGDLRPLYTDAKKKSRKTFDERLQKAEAMLEQHWPKPEAITLDAFLSYSQQDAQDAAALLKLLLEILGVHVWLDSQQIDIGVSGMSRGIAMSRVFLIFMTKSYFEREFTLFELESALAMGKKIIVVWEADHRRGGFPNLKSYIDLCPDKYKVELFQAEAIKFERRRQLQDAQLKVIADRICGNPNVRGHCPCRRCNIL